MCLSVLLNILQDVIKIFYCNLRWLNSYSINNQPNLQHLHFVAHFTEDLTRFLQAS